MSVSSTDLDTNEGVGAEAVDQTADTGASAEPPAADEGKKTPATMLDAVKAAVSKSSGEASPASDGNEGDSGSDDPDAEGAGDEDADGFTEEETARLHSKTRRRVRKLLSQVHDLRGKLETYEPAVQRMQQVDTYIQQSGLTYDEVNEGFKIMSLMKMEPKAAYDALAPYMASLEEVLGLRLPDDLKQKVQQGYVAPDIASELAAARARTAQASAQVQQSRETQEVQQHQQRVSGITNAVAQFENDWKKTDPDYAVKQPRVQEKMELALHKAIRAGNPPRTPQEAIELARKCRSEVDAEFKKFRPQQPRELRPVTGSASAAAAPVPQSTLDVVRRAVGQS